jgi:hypothetical protein
VTGGETELGAGLVDSEQEREYRLSLDQKGNMNILSDDAYYAGSVYFMMMPIIIIIINSYLLMCKLNSAEASFKARIRRKRHNTYKQNIKRGGSSSSSSSSSSNNNNNKSIKN